MSTQNASNTIIVIVNDFLDWLTVVWSISSSQNPRRRPQPSCFVYNPEIQFTVLGWWCTEQLLEQWCWAMLTSMVMGKDYICNPLPPSLSVQNLVGFSTSKIAQQHFWRGCPVDHQLKSLTYASTPWGLISVKICTVSHLNGAMNHVSQFKSYFCKSRKSQIVIKQ